MMPLLQSGALNRRVEIHTPTETLDNYGTVTLTYTLTERAWASIRPVAVSEIPVDEELQATTITEITVRYTTDLAPRCRIVYGSRTWEVLGVRDVDDAHVLMVASCREIAP